LLLGFATMLLIGLYRLVLLCTRRGPLQPRDQVGKLIGDLFMGDRIEARADHLIECAGVVEPTWRYFSLRLMIDGPMVIFIPRVPGFRHWTADTEPVWGAPAGGRSVPDP